MNGCNIRFDEDDDLVIDDIPDDMMTAVEQLANAKGRSVDDEWRRLVMEIARRSL